MNPNTAAILGIDPVSAHRDRLRYLDQRFERAHGDDGREMIQGLIDAENLRWKLMQDSQQVRTRSTASQT